MDIRPDSSTFIEPYDDWYEWRNAKRQTLFKVGWRGGGPSCWHTSNFFNQPALERNLDARAGKQPTVTIRHGLTAVDIEQDTDGISAIARATGTPDANTETIRARYLVGCDGANSAARQLLGIEVCALASSSTGSCST